MRILHCLDTLNPAFGGPVEAVGQLSRTSGHLGCHIEVLTMDDPSEPWLRSWTVPLHPVGRGRTAYSYNPNLRSWLEGNHTAYDVVVIHGIWKYHTVGVAAALDRTETPYFVMLHGMLNPWLKRAYPIKHLKKVLFWRTMVHRALRRATAILYLCGEERELAQQTFKIDNNRAGFVPLGTSRPSGRRPARNELLDRFPNLVGKKIVLFLGRICRMKGCDMLIDAFSRIRADHPDTRLVLAGPDEDGWQRTLMVQAAASGASADITWAGALYGDAKWDAFDACDAFILPSHCETFPVAVLECLASGVVPLITNKVNIWRELDEDDAAMTAPDTTVGTESLLRSWLSLSPAEKNTMRARAKLSFERRYEIFAAAEAHLRVYNRFAHFATAAQATPEKLEVSNHRHG